MKHIKNVNYYDMAIICSFAVLNYLLTLQVLHTTLSELRGSGKKILEKPHIRLSNLWC